MNVVPLVRPCHTKLGYKGLRKSISLPHFCQRKSSRRCKDFSYGPWSIPRSSDPQSLPRLTVSSQCDPILRSTFRALGNGTVEASRGNGEITQDFRVTIDVTPT